jgi:hypothetical protein
MKTDVQKPEKSGHVKGAMTALFVLGLGLLATPLYLVGMRYYHAQERERIRSVLERAEDVEAVVFGSSHAECVDLDVMGLKGENLFSSAQDMFEIDYKVRSLLPRLKHLETAFVSVSYFSFLYDNAISPEGGKNREGKRLAVYAEYPVTLPCIPGDAGHFLKGILHPLITTDHWRRVFSRRLETSEPPESGKAKTARRDLESVRREIARLGTSPAGRAELIAHAKLRCERYQETIDAMVAEHPGLGEDALDVSTSFVSRLERRNVRVVLFTPPYFRDYNQQFDRTRRHVMEKSVDALISATGVEYYDFSHDAEFETNAALFLNSDHLNELGAALFSLKLKDRMDQRDF